MSLASLRRHCAPIAFVTVLAFWNALLHASFARAQEGEATPPPSAAPASAPPSGDGAQTAEGAYDTASRAQLSEKLEGTAPAAPSAAPVETPPDPKQVDKALAALPSGGGAISPQATALPSGAATQLGMGESFTMQLSTGTAGYALPIALPSARGGVQPRLDVSYSAAGGFGLAGVGWSIGASSISRQTDRGIPSYDDRATWHPGQDRFVFGSIELVPICTVSGSTCSGALPGEVMPSWASGWQYFRARVEGTFLRFFWSADHQTWRVQGKDGTNLELGVPLDGTGYRGALESNPDAPSEIFRWHLARQYDSAVSATNPPLPVNVIQYRHQTDGAAVYLTDIYDTSPAATPTSTNLAQYEHHTRLVYEARPDPSESYRSGYLTQYGLRLARIEVASKPSASGTQSVVGNARELVRRYHFAYDAGSHRSLLASVQMEGRCPSAIVEDSSQNLPGSTCPRLPAVAFGYQRISGDSTPLRDGQGLAYEPFSHALHSLANSPPYSLDERHTGLADINADGLPDVLVTAAGYFSGDHGLYLGGLSPSGAVGFGNAHRMSVQPAGDVTDAGVLTLSSPNVTALDLDADGIINLVHMPAAKRYGVFSPQETAPGSGRFQWVGNDVVTASQQDVKIDLTRDARNVRVMDVDGDGLVDIVYSTATELQTFFSLGRYPGGDGQFGTATRTSATTATISNDPVVTCAPWSSTVVRFSDPDTHLADMNGDGMADIV
ncbi:MAG TPA: SpvB/TcaC N-terminal domain-containing protein, partial [Polyangiales bacterium]|nr:SpvB/TcaC N-terminal domain-containing protein [Polyangiales bacterium]